MLDKSLVMTCVAEDASEPLRDDHKATLSTAQSYVEMHTTSTDDTDTG